MRELSIVVVEDAAQREIWHALMAAEHPRGAGPLVGCQLRYLVGSAHGWLGAAGVAASALQLAARDHWIGWDAARRRAHLHRVVGLSRFLIRPEVQCRNLASHVLGRVLRRLPADFEARYGYAPYLVETFVDAAHSGASVRAANWRLLGETAGRGREDRSNAAALGRILREAEVYGYRPEGSNPCVRIRRYWRKGPERFLSKQKLRRLARMLERHEKRRPLHVAFVRLLLLTGCRKSEIATLAWSSYREGHLFLPDSKTGPRTVWLSSPARAARAAAPDGPMGLPVGEDRQATERSCTRRVLVQGSSRGGSPRCPAARYQAYGRDAGGYAWRFTPSRGASSGPSKPENDIALHSCR